MPNSNQVLSWAGISRRQLDNWVDKKYITPISNSGRGFGGVQYEWTTQEAKVIERMGKLTRAGVMPHVAALVARNDRKASEALLYALRACVPTLAWETGDAAGAGARPGVPAESEPCI